MKGKKLLAPLVLAALLWPAAALAAEPRAAELLAAIGVERGLVVHLGADGGRLEADLARGGKFLVHGLALDDRAVERARQTIAGSGLCGLASVQKAAALARLPYADNMVNLLVADLEALGAKAPVMPELLRVLAPRGVAYLKRGGEWSKTVKPRPADTDDWTHFDHGPSGNALSSDARVAPPRQVQWISGVQPMPLGGNPAGFSGTAGIRLASGRMYSDALTGGRGAQQYGAWDAYNGLPRWIQATPYKGRRLYYHVVADGERLYLFTQPGGPLVALDGATGELRKTYDAVGPLPKDNPGLAYLRVGDGKLVVANGPDLFVVNADTGVVLWRYADAQKRLLFFPSVDLKTQRLFIVASQQTPTTKIQHRWPNATAAAVVCLDFRNGETHWINTEIAGSQVGQLVPHGDDLALFAGGGIGAGENPFYGKLDARDGKLQWKGTFPTEWNRAGYSLLWRDGAIYYADPWKIFQLDPTTGAERAAYGRSYNNRCMRFTATPNYLIHGFVSYVDRDWRGTVQSVARSSCANSVFPANGMIYFTPNTCRCFTMLRGHLALTPEALPEPVADAARRETAGAGPATAEGINRHPAFDDSNLIARHWFGQSRAPHRETAPVSHDGKTFVAVTHQHRLECRGAGSELLWAYTAGGRISSPPVIHDGACHFGSHDGYIYAVRVKDGVLLWRFLAAPARRLIVAHGQLESSWPVYGVVLHEGKICGSAGRHPEIGGGIWVWGLEPKTGAVAWKRRLVKSPAIVQGTERTDKIVPSSCLNDVLRSEEGKLNLPGHRELRFAFDPALSDEQLKAQLEKPLPKKKR